MSVVSCPKCSGRVVLPASASADGWVRCPICQAEYQANQLREHAPPELELIDEPACPFEGRVPTWDAVAAAGAAAGSAPIVAPTVSQIAALESDSALLEATDELAVAPLGAAAVAISSADVDDDSNVFTFDDSLLLDEPTDELPRLRANDFGESAAQQVDLLNVGEAETGGQLEWQSANSLEPPPLVDATSASAADELRATAGHSSAVTLFDRGRAAPVMSVPPIGLVPRRKSRRRGPLFFFISVVGGGFLGLVAGYGILMWLFNPPKDPLHIAPRLPGFLVPAALRSSGTERVAQSPTETDAGRVSPSAADAGDGAFQQSPPGKEQFPPLEPFGDATTEPGRANVEPLADPKVNPLATANDQKKPAADITTDQEKDPLADLFGDAAKVANTEATEPTKKPLDAFANDESPATQPSATKSSDSTKDALLPDVLEELGPVTEKRYTHEELLAAIAASKVTTQKALALPVDADAAEKKKVNGPYYLDLCTIAESLTFFERSADKQREDQATTAAIEAILNAVPDPTRLEELGKLAGYWYERPQGKGIVLSGVVKKSNPRGNLVESVVETLGPPRSITVISPSALTDEPSRPVLVIGTIVKDAVKNLRGYQGPAQTVVWATMAIDPSAPSGGRSAR